MAVITVAFGVTGYSLPWDQVGYWAVKIVSGVPAAIPIIGDFYGLNSFEEEKAWAVNFNKIL